MQKWVKIATSAVVVVIVVVLALTLLGVGRKSDPDPVGSTEKLKTLLLSLDSIGEGNYKKYFSQYSSQIYGGEDIAIPLEGIPEKDRTVSAENTVRLPVTVQQAGLYTVGFDYKCVGDNLLQTSLSMKVNGELPYSELQHLFLRTPGEQARRNMTATGMKASPCQRRMPAGLSPGFGIFRFCRMSR